MTEVIKTPCGDICIIPTLGMPEGMAVLGTTPQFEGDLIKFNFVILCGTRIERVDIRAKLRLTYNGN